MKSTTSASCNWGQPPLVQVECLHQLNEGKHHKHKVQRSGCKVQRSGHKLQSLGPASALVGTGCSISAWTVVVVVVVACYCCIQYQLVLMLAPTFIPCVLTFAPYIQTLITSTAMARRKRHSHNGISMPAFPQNHVRTMYGVRILTL